jgi:hypothetical protein
MLTMTGWSLSCREKIKFKKIGSTNNCLKAVAFESTSYERDNLCIEFRDL